MSNLQGFSASLQAFKNSLQGFGYYRPFPMGLTCNEDGCYIATFDQFPIASNNDFSIKRYAISGSYISTFGRGEVLSTFLDSDTLRIYALKYDSGQTLTSINVYDVDGLFIETKTPTHADISTTNDCEIVSMTNAGSELFISYFDSDNIAASGIYRLNKTGSSAATKIYSGAGAWDLSSDGTNIYASSPATLGPGIVKIDRTGSVLASSPGVAVSGQDSVHFFDSNFFVAGSFTGSSLIKAYDTSLVFDFSFGSAGTGDGEFNLIGGMGSYGTELFVADQNNKRIQVFDSSGNFVRKFSV